MSGPSLRRWRWDEPLAALESTLTRGGLLVIPTESSYGLAVDPGNPAAVRGIYDLKGRGWEKPLPLIAANLDQLRPLGVDIECDAARWVEARWPAPLTMVLPLIRPLAAAASGQTIAVRVPAHPGLKRLCEELGPLTSTSANRSGEPAILDPRQLEGWLKGRDATIVDGGCLPGGPPSTVVAWNDGPVVLRQGAYAVVVGMEAQAVKTDPP